MSEKNYSDDCVVIDMGSGYTKAGFVGTDAPEVVFPTLLGEKKGQNVVGESAADLEMKRGPMTRGVIVNADDADQIVSHAFDSLQVNSNDYSLLVQDSVLVSSSMRSALLEAVFESNNCQAVYFYNQATAALLASGRGTGLVVSIGAEVTYSMPISLGFCCSHSLEKFDVGAHDLNLFQKDASLDAQKNPIFNKIFSPGKKTLAEAVCESVATSEENYETRQTFFQNILLTGGLANTPGLQERFMKEIKPFAPSEFELEVTTTKDPLLDVWNGGSIVGLFEQTKEKFIAKEEFEELGVEKVKEKISYFEN